MSDFAGVQEFFQQFPMALSFVLTGAKKCDWLKFGQFLQQPEGELLTVVLDERIVFGE